MRPRTGGTRSSSSSSWVTSLRLPPVSVQASGMPPPSTRRWCLLPARPRSTGLGPVLAPPFSLANDWSRRSPAPTQAGRRRATRRATARATAPKRRPAATPAPAACARRHPEAATDRRRPGADVAQALPLSLGLLVDPAAVVGDANDALAVAQPDQDGCMASSGVAVDVGQALLDDAEDLDLLVR